MASKPSDTLDWVAAGETVDPGAIRTSGYVPGDRLPAQHYNFVLELITQWIAYINDQEFTGDFTVSGGDLFLPNASDVRHALRTIVIENFDFVDTLATGSRGATGTNGGAFQVAASTSGEFFCPIRLDTGQRILEVRVIAKTAGGAATDINARISKTVANVGDASGTQSYLASSQNLPAAVTDIQEIAMTTGLPLTVALGESYAVRCNIANSSGIKYVWRVEVDIDRNP